MKITFRLDVFLFNPTNSELSNCFQPTQNSEESKVSMVKECRCPLCVLRVGIEEFRNKMFIREFETTGLCQGCLDTIFGYTVAW